MRSTKDPHIAMIDAHEKMEHVKLHVRQTMELFKSKANRGELTKDDLAVINAIRAEAIERTKRIQDELFEELESHGKSIN